MDSHKYRVGQTVRFVNTPGPSVFGGTPSGNFRIVCQLPEFQGNNQYRVESTSDSHNRVVMESEIAPISERESTDIPIRW